MRQAHRCIEWDGWEEGLVESIIGPPEQEDEWIHDARAETHRALHGAPSAPTSGHASAPPSAALHAVLASASLAPAVDSPGDEDPADVIKPGLARRGKRKKVLHVTAAEKEREKGLSGEAGDGGELGRRLDALLTLHGNGDGSVRRKMHWHSDHEEEYEAEAE
jgi:hypothetical protein